MAFSWDTIDNPVSGERITFIQTAADTAGELLEFELELSADGRVPRARTSTPSRRNASMCSRGTMTFPARDAEKIVAAAGETVVVPAGPRAQSSPNGGEGVARARVEVVPALDMEDLLTTTTELALEGRVRRSGMPKPLHLALFVSRFRSEVRAPFPPAWMVRALMSPLAAVARARGHHARYGAGHGLDSPGGADRVDPRAPLRQRRAVRLRRGPGRPSAGGRSGLRAAQRVRAG